MDPTVDDVITSLKNISVRQDQISTLEEALAEDVRSVEQNAKLLMSSPLSADDRRKLIAGLAEFVGDTYKRAMTRQLRAQGTLALSEDEVSSDEPEEGVLAGAGGFPRLS